MEKQQREKDLIVTLICYRGKVTLDFDTRKVSSEHAPVKLAYGRLEWKNFMKSAKIQYSKIDVSAVNEETIDYEKGKDLEGKEIKIRKPSYKLIETPQEIIDEVNAVMADPSKKLTPEQEIAQLKKQMAEMSKANKGQSLEGPKAETNNESEETKKEPNEGSNASDEEAELTAWKVKYENVVGKKPHYKWSAETIETKIQEFLDNQ